MQFVYNINGNLDERSIFANKICSLLVSKHNNNINIALENFDSLNANIHNFVRNVYELVDCEIPLMGLFDLLCHNADNWDFTEEEYNAAIERAYEACRNMYCTDTKEPIITPVTNSIPPLSIVKWIGNANLAYPFNTKDSYIYHGEIPNMKGHCVVSNMKTGQFYYGYHIIDFKAVDDE